MPWMKSFGLALLLCSGLGHSSPLLYNEAVDGELEGQNLELDIGTNRIAASARFIAGGPVEDWQFDSDYFYFTIPKGARVDRIALSWETSLIEGTDHFSGSANYMWGYFPDEVWPEPELRIVPLDFRLDASGLQPFAGLLPSPVVDFYRLFMLGSASARGTGPTFGGHLDHQWLVDIKYPTAVAEPGTLALLSLGLLGLAVVARRRLSGRTLPETEKTERDRIGLFRSGPQETE